MKSFSLGPKLLLAAIALVVSCFVGRGALAKERLGKMPLPNSCTLMAMKPADRAVHLKRLEMLRRSMSNVKVSAEGFRFEVDLGKIPIRDLQGWAEYEQKCCSQLKIDSQIVETGKRATVRVSATKG